MTSATPSRQRAPSVEPAARWSTGRRTCVGLVLAAGMLSAVSPPALSRSDAAARLTSEPGSLVATFPRRVLRGLTPADVIGGELRLELPDDDEPTVELERLELDPALLPTPAPMPRRPAADEGCFLISPFEHSSRNRLGGDFSAFARPPAIATAELSEVAPARRGLRFAYERTGDSWAGLSIDLFELSADETAVEYLDARGFQALVFRVRRPFPELVLKIADHSWRQRGDAVAVGPLGDHVAEGGGGPGWAWARLDLDELSADLDRSLLARVVLQAPPGDGEVAIDDLAVCREGVDPGRALARPTGSPPAPPTRALWVWSTRDVVGAPAVGERLLALVDRDRIDRVYLQLPGEFLDVDRRFEPGLDGAVLRPVLAALRAAGAESYALDGAPDYALPPAHDVVRTAVRRVAAFNAVGDPAERFAGVHLDIEPYLLEEWDGPGRQAVAAAYLQVLDDARALASASGLPLEAAIPFWFDGLATPAMASPGGYRPLSDAVIARVDRTVIMAYRTGAEGSNGTVALAAAELDRASRVGRSVLVALETGALPDAELLRFRGRGRPGPPPREGAWIVLADGPVPRVALVRDGSWPPARRDSWATVRHWPVDHRVSLPAERLTFHGSDPAVFRAVLEATSAALGRYPAFAGFAIHHFEPYARLLETAGEPARRPDARQSAASTRFRPLSLARYMAWSAR